MKSYLHLVLFRLIPHDDPHYCYSDPICSHEIERCEDRFEVRGIFSTKTLAEKFIIEDATRTIDLEEHEGNVPGETHEEFEENRKLGIEHKAKYHYSIEDVELDRLARDVEDVPVLEPWCL